MTHQEAVAKCIFVILQQEEEVVKAFCRYDPFDKLLRSYSQCNRNGAKLYNQELAKTHCKMSVNAYESKLRTKDLHGEHRVPISIIRQRLLNSDRHYETIISILKENEMVLITKEEKEVLDKPTTYGGLGLRSSMPEDGRCRLEVGMIEIAPETLKNTL